MFFPLRQHVHEHVAIRIDLGNLAVKGDFQQKRFEQDEGIHCNAQMGPSLLRKICRLDAPGAAILRNAMEKLSLSARAYDRILKVSRTIADLESSEDIKSCHLAEAINYRYLDRNSWG